MEDTRQPAFGEPLHSTCPACLLCSSAQAPLGPNRDITRHPLFSPSSSYEAPGRSIPRVTPGMLLAGALGLSLNLNSASPLTVALSRSQLLACLPCLSSLWEQWSSPVTGSVKQRGSCGARATSGNQDCLSGQRRGRGGPKLLKERGRWGNKDA